MSLDPTGARIHLALERDDHVVTAEVAAVGAALRALTVDGVDCVARYPDGMAAPGAAGIVLVPWANRIRDGRWNLDGEAQQLAITEPTLGTAVHGLLAHAPYLWSQTDTAVTLRSAVFEQPGYPFTLETSVTYALTPQGVTVTHTVRNSSGRPAPVVIGAHPYVALGDVPADRLTLTSSGATVFTVDDRLLPTGSAPVPAALDLRGGRVLADLTLNDAYTDLTRGDAGVARHTLADDRGRTVTLWQDAAFGFTQFYTHTSYPGRDIALAVEPMTAPADAFNSGIGVRWLKPDATMTAVWGIGYTAA